MSGGSGSPSTHLVVVGGLGVGQRSRDGLNEGWLLGVGQLRGSNGLDQGRGGDLGGSLAAHDSVESVDRVSGVVDHTTGAIGLQEAVLSLDDVSVTGLVLVLEVSGDSVLDVVGVVVLRVGVVLLDLLLSSDGDGRLGSVGQGSRSVGHVGGGRKDSSTGAGNQGEESDELRSGWKEDGLIRWMMWMIGSGWTTLKAIAKGFRSLGCALEDVRRWNDSWVAAEHLLY